MFQEAIEYVAKTSQVWRIEVPIPKGHHSDKILGDFEEGSTLELKLPDRRIVLRGSGIY